MHGFSKVFLKKKKHILTKTFKSSSQNNGLFLDPIIKMWLFFYKGNWGHKSSLFVYQKAVFFGGVVRCLLGASSLMRRYYCNINNEAIKNTLCVLGLFFLSYTSLAPFASWPWPNWMPVWRLSRRRSSQPKSFSGMVAG